MARPLFGRAGLLWQVEFARWGGDAPIRGLLILSHHFSLSSMHKIPSFMHSSDQQLRQIGVRGAWRQGRSVHLAGRGR